jgi:hypothetical protein
MLTAARWGQGCHAESCPFEVGFADMVEDDLRFLTLERVCSGLDVLYGK